MTKHTLRDLLEQRGLSVADVAAEVRLDTSRIYKILNGSPPRTRANIGRESEATRLARFLGLSEKALLRLFPK